MKTAILGYGEVGRALSEIYSEKEISYQIHDPFLNMLDEPDCPDILDICIPFQSNFVEIVNEYIGKFRPKLSVIHSSISPGTTKRVDGPVCHSPIRGVHPELRRGIMTFCKFIGAENLQWAREYQEFLNGLGIVSYICKNSVSTELGKLLDTTYYGVCIAIHAEAKKICNDLDLDFEEVMTLFNESYNEGYSELGMPNVTRPILYGTSKIGGHCVVPNAKILKEFMDSPLIDGILKFE